MNTHPPVTGTVSTSQDNIAVSVRGVSKAFGDVYAVQDLDIDIRQGEFFSMLGPSGSGKTTVLRMIAGFEEPTAGTILLEGEDVTNAAPFDRDVNTVFQDYALFPHMTIAENVGYGLKVRKVGKAERAELVEVALKQVKLDHVADRLPSQLSGGQRQRIALARALILRPKVLLLDEPLGARDKQLREEMQIELKQIQREVGITFIFVTHDQEEALTLSDRVAVYNDGRIEQVGTPREVYEYPRTEFVAGFLGVSNLITAEESEPLFGINRMHSIRPERVRLAQPGAAASAEEVALPGRIEETVYTGKSTRYIVRAESGMRILAEAQNDQHPGAETGFRRGDQCTAIFRIDHATAVAKRPA